MVLELAGVEAKHTHFARSLVPHLGGERGDRARAAFCEGGYSRNEPQEFEPLAEFGNPAKIYYPRELNNLFGDKSHTTLQAGMERRMLDGTFTADVVPHGRDARGLPPRPKCRSKLDACSGLISGRNSVLRVYASARR